MEPIDSSIFYLRSTGCNPGALSIPRGDVIQGGCLGPLQIQYGGEFFLVNLSRHLSSYDAVICDRALKDQTTNELLILKISSISSQSYD
jgi:hypothetical protein